MSERVRCVGSHKRVEPRDLPDGRKATCRYCDQRVVIDKRFNVLVNHDEMQR